MNTMVRPPDEEIADTPRPRPRRVRGLGVWLAVCALLGVAALGGAGIIAGRSGAAATPPPPAAPAVAQPAVSTSASPAGGPVVGSASTLQSELIAVARQVGPAVVSIRTDQGLGSGVLYDGNGLILTNAHVVAGATSITVGLADGRHFAGRVLGADAGFDIAVLKVDGQHLPIALLGDSAGLQVGQFVAAIGNPYGFDHTVTTGVVSALNRPVSEGQGSYTQPMVQTDAAINPGNSGGPLVDLQGHVVGITTLVAAPQGVPAQGLGFAVPADTAQRIAAQLATDGRVTHSGQPYLGVRLGNLDSGSASPSPFRAGGRAAGVPAGVDHGVLVGRVEPNGAAAAAGLRPGDVITSFDGRDIYTSDDFTQTLVLHQPGDRVQLGIVRGGQHQTVAVMLAEAPAQ